MTATEQVIFALQVCVNFSKLECVTAHLLKRSAGLDPFAFCWKFTPGSFPTGFCADSMCCCHQRALVVGSVGKISAGALQGIALK